MIIGLNARKNDTHEKHQSYAQKSEVTTVYHFLGNPWATTDITSKEQYRQKVIDATFQHDVKMNRLECMLFKMISDNCSHGHRLACRERHCSWQPDVTVLIILVECGARLGGASEVADQVSDELLLR